MTSLPEAFTARIKKQFPEYAESLMIALGSPPVTSLHVNPSKPIRPWQDAKGVDWLSNGIILSERPSFTLDPLFHAGCYYPQESSSMILDHILKEIYGDHRVLMCLDLCAAPGGKSLIISEFLGNEGRLISNEINRTRNAILRENLIKWSAKNVIVTSSESSSFTALSEYFDAIVVDAPCSGEGMFRKDIDARAEWSEDNVKMCSIRQIKILEEIIPSLKKDGYLIYSTCTFAEEENERNCKLLLATGELKSVRINVPKSWNIDEIESDGLHALRFFPGRIPGEGFFISVFRKLTGGKQGRRRGKRIFDDVPAKDAKLISNFVGHKGQLIQNRDADIFASAFTSAELNTLTEDLFITMPGVELGRMIRSDFIPAHALATSNWTSGYFASLELSLEDALNYLRGDQIDVESTLGWNLLKYQGHSLGWAKVMKNRMNNYYPKEYRIRMR